MMSEFLPMTAQKEIEGVVRRLIAARTRAAVTTEQVERRLSLAAGTISRFERGELEPTLRMFLVLCELYDVSPAWALTGIDPYVNTVELVNLIYATKSAREQIDEAHRLIETVPTNDSYRQLIVN